MQRSEEIYDIIIVGGGISGLYSAYNILKFAPRTKLVVLEAYKKKWFGGRTGNVDFYGTSVVKGAGVGRKNKDHLLIELLHNLNVPYSEFNDQKYYADTVQPHCNVKLVIGMLQKMLKERKDKGIHPTFKEFVLPLLGLENYNHLTTCLGYTDYEQEDAYDVIFNYGFDDNYGKETCLLIPWSKLVEKLAQKIGSKNIIFSSKVVSIKKPDCGVFLLKVENGKNYLCNKVIIATTIKSIVELLPKFPIYKQIHGYNFVRVYGKFSARSASIMKKYVPGYIIVPGPLQKIIPINYEKGVYMIAYSDNQNASFFKTHDLLENNQKNRTIFCSLVSVALGISEDERKQLSLIAIKDFYWPIGTHYCQPLNTNEYKNRREFMKQAQHPMHNILVVGEVVSNDQGWVQGALDSVQKVVNKKWVVGE